MAQLKSMLSEFKTMLASDDPIERYAAIEIGLAHEHPLVRKFAKDAAFSSDDPILQTRALAAYIKSGASLSLKPELPSKADDTQKRAEKAMAGMVVKAREYDESLDEFVSGVNTTQAACKIVERGFQCSWWHSHVELEMQIASPTLLSGAARYTYGGLGTPIPVTAKLQ